MTGVQTCALPIYMKKQDFVVDSFYLRAFINVRKVFNIDYLDNNIAETNKINDLAVNKPLEDINPPQIT